MVTINNKKKYITKRVFITLSFLFFATIIVAQEGTLYDSTIKRDFQLQLFQRNYAEIPSLIHKATISKFSFASVKYLYGEGDFKHPQNYKKQNGFEFETASLSHLKDTKWTLYGSFQYANTRSEGVETNLSYNIYDYNSPYYFFQGKTGLWNLQNYNFSVIGAYKVNNKVTLGGQFNYDTNFYYRKIDTRNEKTALTMEGKLSVSYQLSKKQVLSASLGTELLKSKSILTNIYPENKTDSIYQIYFNTGLGSYLKNNDTGAEKKRNLQELQLHWLLKNTHSDFSVSSSTKIGEEEWINSIISNTTQNNRISKYAIFNQNLKLFFNKYTQNKQFSSSLKGTFMKGEGKVWDSNTLQYNDNFASTQYTIEALTDVFYENTVFNNIGASVKLVAKEQTDTNFGYQLDNTSIEYGFHFALVSKKNEKTTVFSKLNVSYNDVIDVKHDPFAANNLYVYTIGNPVAAYLNTSSYSIKNRLGFNLFLKNNRMLESGIVTNYTHAVNTSNNKDYLNFVVDVTYYF